MPFCVLCCRMLARVLKRQPQLLPPLAPSPTERVEHALHAFWSAAASDALLLFQQPVLHCIGAARQAALQAKVAAFKSSPKLLPLTSEAAVEASNALFHLRDAQQFPLQPLDDLVQQQGQQLELLLKEAAGCGTGPAGSQFRPAHFPWTAACTAVQLVEAFLQAGDVGAAAASAARSASQPAAAGQRPAPMPASWETLPPGYQWALGCLPVLSLTVSASRDAMTGDVKAEFAALQHKARRAMPDRFRQRPVPQPVQRPISLQAQAAPAASSAVGGKGAWACPQPSARQAVEPLARCAAAGQPVEVKQEPLGTSERRRAADNSGWRDCSFEQLDALPRHSKVQVVGLLAKQPDVKVSRQWRLWEGQCLRSNQRDSIAPGGVRCRPGSSTLCCAWSCGMLARPGSCCLFRSSMHSSRSCSETRAGDLPGQDTGLLAVRECSAAVSASLLALMRRVLHPSAVRQQTRECYVRQTRCC